jgi:CDP-paratose 2-epimerase
MSEHYLITGGAGFIGSNYVDRLLARGERVTVFDNLSRVGAGVNLQWLRDNHGETAFQLVVADLQDAATLTAVTRDVDVIVHLAGQVAVTSSVRQPRKDFQDNALGTFNVLEAARLSERTSLLIYASTNKVYGRMQDVRIVEAERRYQYADLPHGIPEGQPLDFHSPYGCSKGAGDQYVRDYYRIYGLPTVVFRQSCIYGPRQFGVEDQGWLAWFVIASFLGDAITIYGDGKQVRDVLYIEDLLDVYDAARDHIDRVAGEVYNIGGGPENTISIWQEFGPLLQRHAGRELPVERGEWRPGDQRVYISDIRKAGHELGWKPWVGVEEGLERLYQWVSQNRALFA